MRNGVGGREVVVGLELLYRHVIGWLRFQIPMAGRAYSAEMFKQLVRLLALESLPGRWVRRSAPLFGFDKLGEIAGRCGDTDLAKEELASWVRADLNRRSPPCQGGVITGLDHEPFHQFVFRTEV